MPGLNCPYQEHGGTRVLCGLGSSTIDYDETDENLKLGFQGARKLELVEGL